MNKYTAIAISFGVVSLGCVFSPAAALGYIFIMIVFPLMEP